jgi:hypothetical protein
MTERHNRVAKVVREAVIKYRGTELQSEIRENTSIPEDQLTEQLRNLRPDIVFERQSRKRGRRRSENLGNDRILVSIRT